MDKFRDDRLREEEPTNLAKFTKKLEKIQLEKEKPKVRPHKIFKNFKPRGKGGKY